MERKRLSIAVAYSGINSEYQDKILRGILNQARLDNYNLAFFAALCSADAGRENGENKIFDLINFELFDAFIVLSNTISEQETLDKLISRAHSAGVPVISVDRSISGCSSIHINYSDGLGELMDHLITVHGCTEINYIGAYEYDWDADARFVAYRKALRRHSIPFDKSRVCFADYDEYKAVTMVRRLLSEGGKLPQAFVCGSDSCAVAVCDELVRQGYSVPKDVIVTGFDGIRYAAGHFPSLTTVEVGYVSAGESTVKIIPKVLKLGKGDVIHAQIKNTFKAGESCGCVDSDTTHSAHNELLKELNSENDRYQSVTKRIISMSEDLAHVNSFESAFRKLVYYIEDIYADRFYLCLNSHFEDDEESRPKCDFSAFSDTIDCRISREHKEYKPRFTFNKKEVLPAFFKDGVFPNTFFITPLLFHNRNYGYIALSCDGYIGNNILFNTWKMNISTELENIRVRSKLTEYSNTLERMYIRDPLTNLLNRRGLLTKAYEMFEIAKSRGKKVFVLAADLDDLKIINDKFGHHEGDNAIIQVGNALSRAVKHRELCGRFGGDEFEVMAFNYSEELAERYIKSVADMLIGYNAVSEKPYNIRASCGYVVDVPREEDTLEDFIKRADTDMYENKHFRKKQTLKNENKKG